MTQTEKQHWLEVRGKGKGQFILREGLLRWGLPFGTLMTITRLIVDILSHKTIPNVREISVELAFFTLAYGWLQGGMIWSRLERDFQNPTEDEAA